MSQYTYTLNRGAISKETHRYYSRAELELMTTYQLREICRQEKLINGIHAPLDKDELIRQIMRFRGREDHLFITEQVKGGIGRLEELLNSARLHLNSGSINGCAKLIAYNGISIEYFDNFTIGYHADIADTNALLVSGNQVCAVFNLRSYAGKPDRLYITKSAALDCREANVRDYSLYCFNRVQSDLIYRLYQDETAIVPENLSIYAVPVLNFEVRELLESNMPLAIDFGSSNTTAGIYLDSSYFEKLNGDPITQILKRDEINYVQYLDIENEDAETPILPSVVGVVSVNGDNIEYAFGHKANQLFQMSYIDEGFCVFYDLKRWVNDADKMEEIVDRNGHRRYVARKEIIKAFLHYVIGCARQRFKCHFRGIHISSPVKQKALFIKLFEEILPDYKLEDENMLDEGVAVLYNSISGLIKQNRYRNRQEYRALIIDCGGGTTDLSSCRFRIDNQRVSYKIDIATAYENGDTDFGGNNLTFRLMQFLKLCLARHLGNDVDDPEELIKEFDRDVFRAVDTDGTDAVYAGLDAAYARAETVLPTRFKDYEHSSRGDYYAVKNNFYFLFETAERIKKEFYGHTGTLRMAVSSIPVQETATVCLLVDRWKLSVRQAQRLQVLKDIPTAYITIYELNLLLKADIYGIVKRFIEKLYGSGELQEFSIMRLTGQSCKIGIFRDALKEFIPGKIIESSGRRSEERGDEHELKLTCLNGAVEYIKDRKFGFADIEITSERAVFPYVVTAFTHTNEEKTLIHSLDRENIRGFISRNMADLTLKLYLKDTEGRERYVYNCICDPKDFINRQPEDIVKKYQGQILQDDVDDIVDRELKFFVLADEARWGFTVVPVLRQNGQLQLGPDQFFRFETEGWVTNFFDGTK